MKSGGLILFSILLCSVILITDANMADAASKSKKSSKTTSKTQPKPQPEIVQVESKPLPNNDPNHLYGWYNSHGGAAYSTKDRSWSHCKVYVSTFAVSTFSNNLVRNNPDKIFYPGDAFSFSYTYGWDGDPTKITIKTSKKSKITGYKCQNLKVCFGATNLAASTGLSDCKNAKILSQKASRNGKTWTVSGTAQIPPDEGLSGHNISLTVSAERYGCYFPKKQKMVCGWGTISTTGSYSPPVLKPKVDVNLSQEYLNDIDGYKSGNLDHTYYLWDAINTVHNPVYVWKKDRVGTLSVKVTKIYDLKLEKEYQCEDKACTYTLVHKGFEPWSRNYEYGSGPTVYNATQKGDIRKHPILYKIDLYNMGILIHKSENTTKPLVARYDPVYENYPYLVLKDNHSFSWGNRQAVALQYEGSVGGGQDDTPGIHEKRRSKINGYDYDGFVFKQIYKIPLNQTLDWSEAAPVEKNECANYDFDKSAFEAKRFRTAMFVKAGYGKISFAYPILYTMLDNKYLFVNATTQNTLESINFGGENKTELTDYVFRYPNTKFQNHFKVLTYDSEGNRTNLPISISLIPNDKEGAEYFQNYLCKKITNDKNSKIADIVLEDTFDKENLEINNGYANLKYKMTSTWFSDLFEANGIDPITMDLNSGIEESISKYDLLITVGDKSRTFSKIVNYQAPFTHIVNMDDDNKLDVSANNGVLTIRADKKFGQITKLTVNGKDLNHECLEGCSFAVKESKNIALDAYNDWGGHAYVLVEDLNFTAYKPEYNWDNASMAIVFIVIGLILAASARKYLRKTRWTESDSSSSP